MPRSMYWNQTLAVAPLEIVVHRVLVPLDGSNLAVGEVLLDNIGFRRESR